MSSFNIRKGTKDDLPAALELIRELALYEKAPEEVTNTLEMMERDGFGEEPVFGFIMAESESMIVGMSLYYFRYSTWKGKRLYLEDLIVTEKFRGKGIGKLLFEQTIETAKSTGCTGVMWQVLDWNEPAINFYKKYNTQFDKEWVNCNINF
ncbi:GNAT family N-acetyltransferase [Marinoscillum sp. MHG1-6]|uniref:GNAT family N-acetyltransferase n=1 Tax=Marinoscillum sp. MHG1-6 TaxID=2959627 RepID=UPI00215718E8|nr:GNAT family N-acetyltransferase [Marinoscillum sp. MHG1-6]